MEYTDLALAAQRNGYNQEASELFRRAFEAESTAADEVMIAGGIYDHAARKRSYELLAEAFGLPASA